MLAWLAATVVAVVIATAAVGSVRSQVTDSPSALTSAEAGALIVEPATTTTVASGSTLVTTTTPPTTADSVPHPSATTSVAPNGTTSTTSTTSTTAATTVSYSKSFETEAGSVRVTVDGGSVTFAGAFPQPGWSVELEDNGPERVKVHFEENDGGGEIEISIRLDDGELKVSVDDHESDD